MYDISDGMKGDADYIEQLMRRLSGYGYNMLVLYMENCFRFPSHPALGRNESLGADEVRRLNEVAQQLGMELVPCVNIAGHAEGFGFMEAHKHLSGDPSGASSAVGQLRVDLPESLDFLEELYADLFTCFSSKYVHIGADEIGIDKQMHHLPEDVRWSIALDRVVHMIELVKRNGKIPLLWGDMLLKHRDTIDRIPDDAIICDWAYFSDPQFKGLSNVESQSFFRDAGKTSVAFPGIINFFGNPVVSVNSTMNIRSFYRDHYDVFQDKARGVILCAWESEANSFFGCNWPWIYLQSKLFSGEDTGDGMGFMREYTRLEWGVDTDGLAQWYDLVDVQVQKAFLFHAVVNPSIHKAVSPMRNRFYKLLTLFVRELFRTENPLPVLYRARPWLTAAVKQEVRAILGKALPVAEALYEQAVNRREEPRLLLEWNKMMLAVLDLSDGLESAVGHYHAAAVAQEKQPEQFAPRLADCIAAFRRMEGTMDALIRWGEVSIELDRAADYAAWWVRQGKEHIRLRAEELETGKSGRRGLVNVEVFIRINPSRPFAARRWKATAQTLV
ncbi:MAG: glycoside hydrolase family 20 [Paenibacillus sp.]|nr:glycoside hydrolase family 20 [Paenibacillus sp.]